MNSRGCHLALLVGLWCGSLAHATPALGMGSPMHFAGDHDEGPTRLQQGSIGGLHIGMMRAGASQGAGH